MKRLLIGVLLVLFLVGCGKTEIIPVEGEPMTIAKDFYEALLAEDYKSLEEDFVYIDAMKEFMVEDELANFFEELNVGKIIENEAAYEVAHEGFVVVVYPTIFEKAAYDINIVFDKNMYIAGFHVGEYSGDKQVEDEKSVTEIIALAQMHLKDLKEEKYDVLMTYNYEDTMKQNVSKEFYEAVRKQLVFDKFVETKEPFVYKMQGFDIVSIPVVNDQKSYNYELVFDGDKKIAGFFSKPYQEKDLVEEAINYEGIALDYVTDTYTLSGILTKPLDAEKAPCVILVHGSGPSDKDETVYQNRPFRDIAEGLAALGVSTYRYDKRTYSAMDSFESLEAVTVYDEVIDDVEGIVKMIDARDDVTEVVVLGHSLGGYLMPLIDDVTDADGYIIMAGLTRSIQAAIKEQINYLSNLDGQLTEAEEAQIEQVEGMYELLKDVNGLQDDLQVLGAYKAYWKVLDDYDPVKEAKDIEVPVLVLQGERDYQVTLEDYNNWLSISGSNWSYKLYPNLNHLMMPGEGKPNNEEYAILNKVDETLIEDIANWMKALD